MPHYFITFKCHVNDTQLFEEILILLLNKIKYQYYSIEKDNTCDRHLHIITQDCYSDRSKVIQVLNSKYFKNAWKALSEANTIINPEYKKQGLDVRLEEDVKYRIGYIFKENPMRRHTGSLTPKELSEATNYFLIKDKYDKEKDLQKQRENIILLTGRTAYAKIIDYCKRHSIRCNSPELYYRMVKDRYAFSNISFKQIGRIFRELRIMENVEEPEDKQILLSDLHQDNPNIKEYSEEREDIERLINILKDKQLTPEEQHQFTIIKNKHFITT